MCDRQSSQRELPRLVGGDSTVADQAERYGQVIRLISHDLRNPLTAVQLNAQLIERGASRDGREKDQRWASLIVSAARRLDTMLQQLAEAECVRSGRTKLALTPLTFDLFLREFLAGPGPEFDANRIRVTLPTASLAVLADRARLGQALLNLFRLASQQADASAAIIVDVRGSDREVSCTIRVPTAPDVNANEPINRGPREVAADGRAVQCDGLTLYVSRTLIECHGGTLKVVDRTDAVIAFEIVLPAVHE
jgi:K+-sensing histidine kinase KdpD